MKKIIETENADKLFEKLSDDPLFNCKNSISGMSIKYNGIFTVIGNPKINLIKLNASSIQVDILPSAFMLAVTAVITLFFWGIAVLGILKDSFPLGGIITAFVAPSFMWGLEWFFISKISNIIVEEINKRNN